MDRWNSYFRTTTRVGGTDATALKLILLGILIYPHLLVDGSLGLVLRHHRITFIVGESDQSTVIRFEQNNNGRMLPILNSTNLVGPTLHLQQLGVATI